MHTITQWIVPSTAKSLYLLFTLSPNLEIPALMKCINLLFLLLLGTGLLSAQSAADKEKAMELGRAAITKMDNGEIQESLDLLEQAAELDPDNNIYPYEIAYAHYLAKTIRQPSKALKNWRKNLELVSKCSASSATPTI